MAFHVALEQIHPFQGGNSRVDRLIPFKGYPKHYIVTFIIGDDLKLFYYRDLKEGHRKRGYLMDTFLTTQSNFKSCLNYFRIFYLLSDHTQKARFRI